MTYGNSVTAYRETQVMRSKEQIVPLLYHHLLVNLRRTAAHIRAQDFEGKAESVTKAKDIIYELLGSLNFDVGGEIAQRLASLYTFWLEQLQEISRTLDTAKLDKITEMVAVLHESWAAAAAQVDPGGPRGDVA
jgi:flagellar protein FliS